MKNHKEGSLLLFRGSFIVVSLLALIVLFPACYEAQEGCLDPNAVNFSLDADRDCIDCCSYPELSIRILHQWTDQDTSFTFSYNSQAYRDAVGNPFAIERITYYLQNFALLNTAGTQVFTTDSVLVQKLSGTGSAEEVYIRDNFLLINPLLSSAQTIGALEQNGTFTQLQFQLGINETIDDILPGSLPTNHPISFLDTSMYDLTNSKYVSNRIDLRRDTAATAAEVLLSYGSERPAVAFSIEIPGGFSLPAGFDLDITLSINYAEWFESIENIDSASASDLIDSIVANLSNSISLVEITAELR